MRKASHLIQPFPLVLGAILALTAIPLGIRQPSLSLLYLKWNSGDILGNILLYIPFGLAFSGRLRMAVLLALCISAAVELAQFFAPSRYPGMLDVASNVVGAALGNLVAIALRHWGWHPGSLRCRRWTPWAALVVGVALLMALAPHEIPADFSNWDQACQFVFGDELGGGHRWRGEILEAQLLTVPVSPDLIRTRAKEGVGSLSAHKTDLPQAPAFDWNHPVDTREDPQFMPFNASAELYYEGIRRNQLTALIWVRTADSHQRGRIMSYSGARSNNFLISQQDTDISLQLRTPLLAALGSGQLLKVPAALEPGRVTLIAAVYDGRRIRIYADGHLAGEDDFGAQRIPFSVPALGLAYGAGATLYLAWVLFGLPRLGRFAMLTGVGLLAVLLIPNVPQAIYRGLSPSLVVALAAGIYASDQSVFVRKSSSSPRTSSRN